MRRRRRKRAGGGSTRRRFLAGSLLALGGVSVLGGTQAFSQGEATRAASVGTAEDGSALLGLDLPEVAAVGVGQTGLLSITNNADGQFATSIDVTDLRGTESFQPSQITIDQSEQVTASLDADRATDEDPVGVGVSASGSGVEIELQRTVPIPSFAWNVFDNSQYGHVQFDTDYSVAGVPSFDRIDVEVVNTVTGMTGSYTRSAPEDTITYPVEQDREWNAEGDEYEMTFDVYDTGAGHVLHKVVTVTGGESAGEGDPGDGNAPEIDWIFVDDNSSGDTGDSDYGADYTVYYQISKVDTLGEVEVTFDHESDWASESTVTLQRPVGAVEYDSSALGDEFDIVVVARSESGRTVDSVTRSDIADGENPNNPDIAAADSPTFGTHAITDESSGGGAGYTVNYEIDNAERFGEVRARFENLDGNQETNETITDSTGSFTYSAGYTGGQEYRITARVFEDRDGVHIPVDTRVITDVADGQDP